MSTRRARRSVTMRVKAPSNALVRKPGINAGHARTLGAHPPGYLGSGTRRRRTAAVAVGAYAAGRTGRAVHRRRKARKSNRQRRDSEGRFR